jgi:hypothetical protein
MRTRLRIQQPALEYLRAVETQKRGALHLHVIVWSPEPLDPHALHEMALDLGFGCQMDLAPIESGSKKHAYYVAKYVTKSTSERYAVPWNPLVVDEETGEMTHPERTAAYRTWSQSRGFGVTMKFLRRQALAARNVHLARLAELVPVDQVPDDVSRVETTCEASSP